jgi:3-methyladenine DNA glycosylase AlkD
VATPPASPDVELVARIRSALADAGDPVRAEGQQRYMKSAMPYRGITSPELRMLLRPLLAAYMPASRTTWEATVRDLWDGATHREERYAALAVAQHRRARAWLDPESLPLWRHLVVTGAWWDLVDETATHLVRDTLAGHAESVTPVIDAWSVDEDLWLRRTSVICQVGRGPDTDTDLLRRVVEANLADRSFWLRKAIGWALRDFARTDPTWVWAEVDRLGDRLSGLSRREATKHRS